MKNIPDVVYHQPASAGSAGIDISEADSGNERLQVINEDLHQDITSVALLLASRHSRTGFLRKTDTDGPFSPAYRSGSVADTERHQGQSRQGPGQEDSGVSFCRDLHDVLHENDPGYDNASPNEVVQVTQVPGLDRLLPVSSAITGIPMSVRTTTLSGSNRCRRSMKTLTIVSQRMSVITESIFCVSGNILPIIPL